MERKEGEVVVSDLATQLILARLDAQDKTADATKRAVDGIGKTVVELAQRVTVIEAARLPERVTALEGQRYGNEREASVRREVSTRRRAIVDKFATSAVILASGVAAAIGHALHWW